MPNTSGTRHPLLGGGLNIGLQHGLISKKHIDSMGMSIWLYAWCIWRQTKRNGLVLGGSPLTYSRIERDLGCPRRTVQRWLKALQVGGYIEVTYLSFKRLKIRILKPKKHGTKQMPLPMEQCARSGAYPTAECAKSGASVPPKVAHIHAKSGAFKQSSTWSNTETPEIENRPSRATPIFEGFELSADMIVFANEKGIDPIEEFSAFVDYHKAKGSVFKDWQAAWRTWVRNAVKFNGGRNGSTKQESFGERRSRKNAEALQIVLGRFDGVARTVRRDLPPALESVSGQNLRGKPV